MIDNHDELDASFSTLYYSLSRCIFSMDYHRSLPVHYIDDVPVRVHRYAIGMARVEWVASDYVVAQMVAD